MYPNTGGWGSQYYRRRQPGEGEQRAHLFERRGSRAPAHAPTAARDPSPVCANTPAAKSSADIRTKLIHLKSKLTESPLPKEFNDVVTRLSCKLCGVTSPEPKYMKPHWKSVKHEDEVRYWLVHWYRDLRADEDLWNNRPKAYEYEEDEAYCFICMKPFTSSEIAQVHYDSKQHEKRILNLLCPMALSKYDEICVFMCEICNVTCPTKQQLEIHKNSPNHAKKLRVLGIDVEIPVSSNIDQPHNEMKYECKICNIKTYTEESLKIHVTGTKHLRKFKKASGEGVIDPAGICGQNIFTYECKICSVISDTHEMLDVHIQSKKHKSSVEKRKDKQDSKKEVDTVKLRPTQSNLLNDKYKCDICNIHANAEGQFRMHMESAKHAKAVARYNALNQRQAGPSKRSMQDSSLHSSSHIPSKQVRSCGVVVKQEVEHNEVTVKKEAPCDRVVVKKEVEHDEEIDSERVISNSTQLLLRRYHHLVLHCIRRGRDEYEAARSCIGCCGQLFLMLMPGEFIWHTLQRNRCIWHKDMNCSSSVVLSDNNDVWRVTATFAGMSATAEGSDMQSTRLAAGELMLNKLQRIYFTVRMPKDVYEKLENFENFDEDDEEEEEQVVEEGILTYESDDEELVEIKVEKEEVLIESKLYMIKKEDQVNKGFEEMVKFYLNDYMANLEDFRDMVFVNFSSEERSAMLILLSYSPHGLKML